MQRRRKKHAPSPPNRGGKVDSRTPEISRQRKWLFRLVTVVVFPLALLALLETGLRLGGFGHPTSFLLPLTINGRESWIENDRFGWRFFGPELARLPCPLAVPKAKSADTVRIFVFGESAAYGDPQPEFGLPRMLQALLSERYPGTRFEVVNAAMTAINSHVVLPIARDCATANGDIWVVYMGNNEVVGPYGAGTVFGAQAANRALVRAGLALKATRTGQFLDGLLRGMQKRPLNQAEWGGMEMFIQNQVRQDDPRMAVVYDNFERNLADIVSGGLRNGAKVVVSTVAVNLKDCAPFGSLHRTGLAAIDLVEWERLYQKGAEAEQAGRNADAVESFRQAGKIDGTFAEMHFRWGRCCLALGQDAEALRQFGLARDFDTLRFRADSRENEIIRRAASDREREGVRLADAEAALTRESPRGLIGAEYLHEHVHLNFEGNYLLARTIAEQAANFLPEAVLKRAPLDRPWPSAKDCAKRLSWSEWDDYEAESDILGRINDPPFATQLNHAEQYERLRRRAEQLLPATQPAALRQAEQQCRDALAVAPDDWVLHRNHALVQQKLGDFTGAAESWRRVLEFLPQYTAVWEELGLVLAQLNRDEEAIQAFHQALRLDPGATGALNGLAQVFAHEGRNEDAVREYELVLRLKPYWSQAHLGLGHLLETMGRKPEADGQFRQALQNRVYTSPALSALGRLCFEKGWLNEAVTNFTDSLRLNPSDAATHVNLGMTLGMLGRRAEAQSHYAEAVRLDPNIAEAHFRLGFELGRQGDDAGALEQFAEAVRLKPDLLEARSNLGIALVKQHRETEALEQFQEVLRREPNNPTALKYVEALSGNTGPKPSP
ncbi:MAG TPA: tetratricopeptide repeat protein [Verrucomicrobiae bacterium]|nr:tetratricopeptide repeat protein [Verrucomicrobiae bacterium]